MGCLEAARALALRPPTRKTSQPRCGGILWSKGGSRLKSFFKGSASANAVRWKTKAVCWNPSRAGQLTSAVRKNLAFLSQTCWKMCDCQHPARRVERAPIRRASSMVGRFFGSFCRHISMRSKKWCESFLHCQEACHSVSKLSSRSTSCTGELNSRRANKAAKPSCSPWADLSL